jgi:peptidoglycan/LPS O-acetylase OafA/YrhL
VLNRTAPPLGDRRIAGLEGLRGIAALSVLFFHLGLAASFKVVSGPIGIFILPLLNQGLTLFFVLSGFLLFRPFAAAIMEDRPLPRLWRYAQNRLLRIYPAYIVVFTVTALVIGQAFVKGAIYGLGADNVGRLSDGQQILANLLLVQTFSPEYITSGLPVSWSLTTELTFYALLPLMAGFALWMIRRGANRVVALACLPLTMAALGTGATFWSSTATIGMTSLETGEFQFGHTWSAVLLRSLLGQADLFGYGMAAALIVVVLKTKGTDPISSAGRLLLIEAAAVVEFLGITLERAVLTNLSGIAAALVLLAVVSPSADDSRTNRLASALEWRPLRVTGLISYSIYLWHMPVLLWLITHHATFGDDAGSMILNGALVLTMTLPLAALTYCLVERPALRLKKPRRMKPGQ